MNGTVSVVNAGEFLSTLGVYDKYASKLIKVAMKPASPRVTGDWTSCEFSSIEVMFEVKTIFKVRSENTGYRSKWVSWNEWLIYP